MITYRVGDAAQPPERPACIVHVVNNVGAWGRGFTSSLDRWPSARTTYQYASKAGGRCIFTALASDGLFIAHLVAMNGVRSTQNPVPLQLDWLAASLSELAQVAPADLTFHMPRLGCGLAGGRWSLVEPLIGLTLEHRDVYVYDLGAP